MRGKLLYMFETLNPNQDGCINREFVASVMAVMYDEFVRFISCFYYKYKTLKPSPLRNNLKTK